MIKHISANSVNQALHDGLYHLSYAGLEEPSRNGPVLVSPMPVMTTYNNPANRVLINSKRDPNPFFHLFEALWMLAGRNDVAFPAKFASNLASYSDDKETLYGAYGFRWRQHFGYDQLPMLIEQLKHDPKTRRAVLQMWDAGISTKSTVCDDDIMFGDLERGARGGLDVPCNTAAYFDTIGGNLNMTITCRSNDIVWGAYGANAVHFSVLLEYMAAMIGLPMGVYRQFSNNFHAYASVVTKADMASYADTVQATCPYSAPGALRGRTYDNTVRGVALIDPGAEEAWHRDLEAFMNDVWADNFQAISYETNFFRQVVGPMWVVWSFWKQKDFDAARHASLTIVADDWRLAAQEWLAIRERRRAEKS